MFDSASEASSAPLRKQTPLQATNMEPLTCTKAKPLYNRAGAGSCSGEAALSTHHKQILRYTQSNVVKNLRKTTNFHACLGVVLRALGTIPRKKRRTTLRGEYGVLSPACPSVGVLEGLRDAWNSCAVEGRLAFFPWSESGSLESTPDTTSAVDFSSFPHARTSCERVGGTSTICLVRLS